MKKRISNFIFYSLFFIPCSLFFVVSAFSQSVGIGTSTPHSSSQLDIRSNSKGLLIPRMTTSEVTSVSNPAKGLMVYDTVKNQLLINMGSTASPNWQTVVFRSGWSLNGNSGINTATDFIGTTDNRPLNLRVNNQKAGQIDNPTMRNTFLGYQAGNDNAGSYNTGIGQQSLFANTTGGSNVAVGDASLMNNTTGQRNIAIGANALAGSVAGNDGIAIGTGAMAMHSNTSTQHVNNNVAIGYLSLSGSVDPASNYGNYNTAVGNLTMRLNSTGGANTAMGFSALYANTTGSDNVAMGSSSLYNSTTGNNNTACGSNSLFNNTTGHDNTALGYYALQSSTTGSNNTAVGSYALFANNGTYNTAVGGQALQWTIGGVNTAIGYNALSANTTGAGNAATGYGALLKNTTGIYNTACGYVALVENVTGLSNTAIGANALYFNNNSYNTGVGVSALGSTTNSQYNTAVGNGAGDSYNNGYNNVFLGANVDVNAAGLFNVIAIGQATIAPGSSTARFGNPATASYGGWANWSDVSDGRFKKDIKDNIPGIDFINKLRPVTYRLAATELDEFLHKNDTSKISFEGKQVHAKALSEKEKIIYSGFIAQEVEAAAKQLGFDFSGVDAPRNADDTYGLRYAEFVVPLVKAVQELSKQNDELKKQNEELVKRIEKLESFIVNKK